MPAPNAEDGRHGDTHAHTHRHRHTQAQTHTRPSRTRAYMRAHVCTQHMRVCAHDTCVGIACMCARVTYMRVREHTCARTRHMSANPRSRLELFAGRRPVSSWCGSSWSPLAHVSAYTERGRMQPLCGDTRRCPVDSWWALAWGEENVLTPH